jgi:DUF438 domain-containing protein
MDNAEERQMGLPIVRRKEDTPVEKITKLKDLFSTVVCSKEPVSSAITERGLFGAEPEDIALAEQSLLESGYSQGDLRRLYPLEMQLLGNQTHRIRASLPANHVVRRIVCEHELILCFLADLEDANNRIRGSETRDDTAMAYRKLEHTVWHLTGMAAHHGLEDDVIMPELKNRGYSVLAEAGRLDHVFIDASISKLAELVKSGHKMQFSFYKRELNLAVSTLVSACREHIFREDNIMLPTALKVIDDPKAWQRINDYCDDVSYCCMHGGL